MSVSKDQIAEDNSWFEKLKIDLAFIQRQAMDNHPGWVDEDNPGFKRWLRVGFDQALRDAWLGAP